MILDRLEDCDRYRAAQPAFAAALDFLQRADLAALPDGRADLDGDRLYALIQRTTGRGRASARLEIHRRYLDIQYVIAGDEVVGWRSAAETCTITQPFDESKDIGYFDEPPALWLPVPPGSLAVFFPGEPHAPLAGTGPLHKVVIKVKM
ncbi:MAG: YhcH/YjgK/YiaL family protein [Kiritimatiellaeota bacterium]|nr:YhcH/YjgK/YiaL family protein [Kiritimatiellota bacterium]